VIPSSPSGEGSKGLGRVERGLFVGAASAVSAARRLSAYLRYRLYLEPAERWALLGVGLVLLFVLGVFAVVPYVRAHNADDSPIKVVANGNTLTGTLVTTTTPSGSTQTVIRYETRKGEKRSISTTAAGVTLLRGGTTTFLLGHTVAGANMPTTVRTAVPGPTVTHTNTVTQVQTVTETLIQTVTETQVQTVTETVGEPEP
jgi:hypothetical protein